MSQRFEDLAGAILDGQPVDWREVDVELGPVDPALVDQLKTLDALRQLPRAATSAPAPSAWGHLRVLQPIGRGAFGTVYLAWDPRLDREVALKLLDAESAQPDHASSDVIEEGRLLARVRHPNVVTLYGADRIDGVAGLWMELVTGRTLDAAWRDGRRPTLDDVRRVGVDLCRAVAAVHGAGLLHRDIKTRNVMIADDGRLVLMDLGAGGPLADAAEPATTGTPLYLAPEVLRGRAATVRSDVYGVGVVLYWLLAGAYPLEAADLAGLRAAHDAQADRVPSFSGRAVPRQLRTIVTRALATDPGRRFATATEMGDALAAIADRPAIWRVAAYAAATVVASLALLAVAGGAPGPRPAWLAGAAPSGAVAAREPAIAVLPFANLSPEPDSDYFVDGLTAEVIHDLSGLDGLQVRSQTSSFAFKGAPRDLGAIRDHLRVDFVVEADVLRVGNRLRINARLVTADDAPLWSERFDRTVDDVFAIQDEISRAIVDKLRLTLNRGQRRYRTGLPAYDTYLRARTLVSRRGTESAAQARELFEQVIAADPSFAPAHAGLAHAYGEMSWQLTGLTPDEGLRGMRPMAARALELDPLLAEAHAAMAITSARERDWTASAASFERAIGLNPSLTQIHASYALSTLVPVGALGRAEQLLTSALTMDPLSPMVRRDLAWVQFCRGRFAEAIAGFEEALAADPTLPFATQGLARALTAVGRPDEAIAIWHRRPASDGDWERWLSRAYVLAGRKTDVDRLVAAHRQAHPYRQAIVFAALGDNERTLDALASAVDLAPHRTAQMLEYPEMAAVRGDVRFATLRKRLNLP